MPFEVILVFLIISDFKVLIFEKIYSFLSQKCSTTLEKVIIFAAKMPIFSKILDFCAS